MKKGAGSIWAQQPARVVNVMLAGGALSTVLLLVALGMLLLDGESLLPHQVWIVGVVSFVLLLGVVVWWHALRWYRATMPLVREMASNTIPSADPVIQPDQTPVNQQQSNDRAKREFLEAMSYEIRTPLSGVVGMTQLLIDSGLDLRQQRFAETAYRSATSLMLLVDQILDFSRLEKGQLQLFATTFHPREFLDELLDIFADAAQLKGLQLVGKIDPDLPDAVLGDQTRLRQVLVCLLDNAIKFTEQGSVRLGVSVIELDEQRATLEFCVCDTGPGVDPAMQTAIFTAFSQTEDGIQDNLGGIGLGLANASRLVELMGGELLVESQPGVGSLFGFEISLPLNLEVGSPAPDLTPLQGLRMLVVGDLGGHREFLQQRTQDWGVIEREVDTADQAIDAVSIAAAEGKPYQVLVINQNLPDMSGLELVRRLRRDPLIPSTQVILTGPGSFKNDHHFSPEVLNSLGVVANMPLPLLQLRLLDCLLQLTAKDQSIEFATSTLSMSEPAQTRRAHVLLVEDEPLNQEVVQDILTSLGYRVSIAGDGKKALQWLEERDCDLILMDYHMPVLDGLAATRELRAREHRMGSARIPVIALSADVHQGIRERFLEAGMDDHVSKPFRREELAATLARYLATDDPSGPQQHPLNKTPPISAGSLMSRLIDLLEVRGTEAIQGMRVALQKSDGEAISEFAHQLKSASANVGASALSDWLGKIESAARDQNLDQMAAWIEEAEQLLELALQTLHDDPLAEFEFSKLAQQGAGIRVLLVDDDEAFRLAIHQSLQHLGFMVEQAASGEAALRRLEGEPHPDVILLDALMPSMNGFEVCRRLKRQPVLADIPIIMVTGLEDESSINHAFEVGASGFASKPLNLPALSHQIRFTLRAASTERALREQTVKLAAAQRIARLGSWRWLASRDVFSMSDQLLRMCNIQPREFGGTLAAFLKLILAEDRSEVKKSIHAALISDVSTTIEYRLKAHDGATVVSQQIEARMGSDGSRMLYATVQDVSRQRAADEKIRKLAYFDALTGLASRSHLHQRLHDSIKAANRRGEKFALLFLDLDGFKTINDSLGHEAGDQLLVVIAKRLRNTLRETDFAARLGGDEFCLLLEQISDEFDAAEFAQRCLQKLAEETTIDQKLIRPAGSIGIALFPRDGVSSSELLKAADSAMYAAKHAGKHRYAFYSQQMTTEAEQKLVLENELRQALHDEQFVLYFQPQVDMRSGCLIGVEALVRWQHPQRGLLLPSEFIEVVEKIGLISELGEWVLRQAVAQMQIWHRKMPNLTVAVNVSPSQLQNPQFISMVSDLTQADGVNRSLLELEVTESVIQVQDQILESLHQLKQLGIGLAIDDFGTGYSSLSSLKCLPVDKLKIDQIFLRNVFNDEKDAVMLGTIIGLAHALSYKVIAEGVETFEQVQVLAGFGCDQVQGFELSHPVPVAEIETLFNRCYVPGQGFVKDAVEMARES